MTQKTKTPKSTIKELNASQAAQLNLSAFNRELKQEHVAELMSDMMHNFQAFGPITVSERNTIIDGAHRREAFVNCVTQGKLPSDSKLLVKVISVPVEEEQDLIRKTNSHTKSWTMPDYVKANIAAGNDSIKKLAEWCSTRELCLNEFRKKDRIKYTYGLAFLTGKKNVGDIQNNTLKLSDEDIELGTAIYDEINELRQIIKWEIPNNRFDYWAMLWRDARNWHPFAEWRKEFKKQAKTLQREIPYNMASFSKFLAALDSSISHNAPKKKMKKETKKTAKTK